MRVGTGRTGRGAIGVAIACWLGLVVSVAGQGNGGAAPPAAEVPQISDRVFKNVKVLKGIPVDEFMDTMGMFAASLGYDCASCHGGDISTDRSNYAKETPNIQKARQMVLLVNSINGGDFAGRPLVSCFTCHRGQVRPESVPSLELQYAELKEDPSSMVLTPSSRVTVDQVFDKYMQALGGEARVAAITSLVATGTYSGFNTRSGDVPIEITARSPNQRVQVVKMPDGNAIKTYDGREAWAAEGWRPMPLLQLTGGNLQGVQIETLASFPAQIRRAYAKWEVATVRIDGKPFQVAQGTNPGQTPVNFYFDQSSGLLTRIVRWNRTKVGAVPSQIDFSDYRDVGGVKMPFETLLTWTDGQNTIKLSDVKTNVPVDAARFVKPAPFRAR